MADLRAQFSAELKRVLAEQNISVTDAAATLGVSRQAFHGYLNSVGLPRQKVFNKAIELWGIQIHIGDQIFGQANLSAVKSPAPTPVPKQLGLWDSLDSIKQEDLKIAVKRVGKELRVSVTIGITA